MLFGGVRKRLALLARIDGAPSLRVRAATEVDPSIQVVQGQKRELRRRLPTLHRIIRPGCGGRDPLRDQPTNPSTTRQECEFRDPRKSLSPARVAGCVQQNQTGSRCGRRGPKVVFDSGDIRGLFEEIDSSALACLLFGRRQGNRGGKVAQDSLLSKNWCSIGTGQQSEDQKHHECSLFPRDSMGVGRQESNQQSSTERETAECTRRFDSGRDRGIPEGIVRSTSDDDRAGCFHRSASRRTDRPPMAGYRFRKLNPASSTISCSYGREHAENRGISQGRTTRRANGRMPLGVEGPLSISRSERLGVCFSTYEGQTAILAWNTLAVLCIASPEKGGNHQARLVSHFPAHIWDSN